MSKRKADVKALEISSEPHPFRKITTIIDEDPGKPEGDLREFALYKQLVSDPQLNHDFLNQFGMVVPDRPYLWQTYQ